MNTLIFSQTAIFRLQQLATHYYHHTGRRHKLAKQDGILELLQFSALVTDSAVRSAYDDFIRELNKRQINTLVEKGVTLRFPGEAAVPYRQATRH